MNLAYALPFSSAWDVLLVKARRLRRDEWEKIGEEGAFRLI